MDERRDKAFQAGGKIMLTIVDHHSSGILVERPKALHCQSARPAEDGFQRNPSLLRADKLNFAHSTTDGKSGKFHSEQLKQ